MFTAPPYPPKDYALKEIPKIARSAPDFTPDSEPRVTQTTLGVFCAPIEYKEGETPDKIQVQTLSPYILEKWANADRAWWVDKPGKDDYFLHHIFNKYNVKFGSYNPNDRHMEKVFNRSYKYELVCLEERRLQKLRDKCEREQATLETLFKTVEEKEQIRTDDGLITCKLQPPFWWNENNLQSNQNTNNEQPITPARFGPGKSSGRWAKEPCLTAVVVDDPCRRKYDMQLVGQPFKNEACNFYYDHYPPPDLKFIPKKFT